MSPDDVDEEFSPDEAKRRLGPEDFRALESASAIDEQDGTALAYLGRGPPVSQAHSGDWILLLREGGRYFALETGSTMGERWLAIPISEARRAQIVTGHVPLTEAIGFAEWGPYRLVGPDPFRPKSAERIRVRSIPHSYYPTELVAVDGSPIAGLTPKEADSSSSLRIHLVAGKQEVTSPSLSEVGAIQRALENFIETTRPFLRLSKFSSSDIESMGDPTRDRGELLGEVDWPRLGLAGAKVGTLLVELETGTFERGQEPSIQRALPELAPISADASSPIFLRAKGAVGGRTAVALLTLGATLESYNLSLLVGWRGDQGPEHVMVSPLSAHEGAKELGRKAHDQFASGAVKAPVVRVYLSKAEAAVLGREADPLAGGFEKLLAELKDQVRPVGHRVELWLRADQIERIIRYIQSYGPGGAQDRLKPVYQQLRRLGPSLSLLR